MTAITNYYHTSTIKDTNVDKVVTDNGAEVIVIKAKGVGQHGDHSSTHDISLCMIGLMHEV